MRFRLLVLALLVAPALGAQPLARPQPLDPAALPAAARAALLADGDENWDGRFGHPSITYTAYTLAVAPDGDLYLGGSFSAVGQLAAAGIARWDGQRWHALGAGIPGGYVYALAFGPDGALYAGGYFTQAGGVRANSIARWDGATETWSAVGAGLSNGQYTAYVYALAFEGATLYAGGDFTSSGATPLKKLARWTGAAWEDLGSGLGRQNYDGTFSPEGPSDIRALAAQGTSLFVGGGFDAVAEGRSNSLARYDAQTGTFHTVGGGVGSGFNTTYESAGRVLALAAQPGRVCVGGRFDRVGLIAGPNAAANNVACWDGAAWQTLGLGVQGPYGAQVNGLGFAGDDLVVTGDFDTAGGGQARYAARWDGMAWAEVGGGLGSAGSALAADGQGGFFVTGGFERVGDGFGALRIAHWTADGWNALGQGLSYSTIVAGLNAVAQSGGRVYVGGYQTHSGGVPTANISAWDGQRWHALGAGTDNTVRALATGADGMVYAGGDFTTAGGQAASHVARWDAATETWSPLGSGLSGNVYALAVGPDGSVYAGGSFRAAGAVATAAIARWDGQQWHALGEGFNDDVRAIAIAADGRVYAGGLFDKSGATVVNGIAVWDGVAWRALGEGVKRDLSGIVVAGDVYGLALVDGDVYAAGRFDIAGAGAASGVARWRDGAGWQALGAGLGGSDHTGRAFARVGRTLFVGGTFASAGGQPSSGLARWDVDAATWRRAGSGVAGAYYSDVNALLARGGDVYVVGHYEQAGGAPAASFTLWHDAAPTLQAGLQVDPDRLDFGSVPIGTASERLVSISNPGDGPLTGTVALAAGSPFTLVEGGGAFTLAPGGFLGVTVRFTPAAGGAATATLRITHDAPGVPNPYPVQLVGEGAARGAHLVLRHFNPADAQTTPGAQGGGFVFGTNAYKDRAKGVAFTLPLEKNGAGALLTSVNAYFSYADPLPGAATYTVSVVPGSAQTGPTGAPLWSASYRVADTGADDDLATPAPARRHEVTPPVELGAGTSFFAVVDFGDYASSSLLAIAASPEKAGRVPHVWEQLESGQWVNVSDSWKGGSAGWDVWMEAELATATARDELETPSLFALEPISPNPLNSNAMVRYTLARVSPVEIEVFDLLGRRVMTLAEGVEGAGAHQVALDAGGLPNGLYVCRLRAAGQTLTQTFTVLK